MANINYQCSLVRCDQCLQFYSTRHNWQSHCQTICPKFLTCSVCHMSFNMANELHLHCKVSGHKSCSTCTHITGSQTFFQELREEGKIDRGINSWQNFNMNYSLRTQPNINNGNIRSKTPLLQTPNRNFVYNTNFHMHPAFPQQFPHVLQRSVVPPPVRFQSGNTVHQSEVQNNQNCVELPEAVQAERITQPKSDTTEQSSSGNQSAKGGQPPVQDSEKNEQQPNTSQLSKASKMLLVRRSPSKMLPSSITTSQREVTKLPQDENQFQSGVSPVPVRSEDIYITPAGLVGSPFTCAQSNGDKSNDTTVMFSSISSTSAMPSEGNNNNDGGGDKQMSQPLHLYKVRENRKPVRQGMANATTEMMDNNVSSTSSKSKKPCSKVSNGTASQPSVNITSSTSPRSATEVSSVNNCVVVNGLGQIISASMAKKTALKTQNQVGEKQTSTSRLSPADGLKPSPKVVNKWGCSFTETKNDNAIQCNGNNTELTFEKNDGNEIISELGHPLLTKSLTKESAETDNPSMTTTDIRGSSASKHNATNTGHTGNATNTCTTTRPKISFNIKEKPTPSFSKNTSKLIDKLYNFESIKQVNMIEKMRRELDTEKELQSEAIKLSNNPSSLIPREAPQRMKKGNKKRTAKKYSHKKHINSKDDDAWSTGSSLEDLEELLNLEIIENEPDIDVRAILNRKEIDKEFETEKANKYNSNMIQEQDESCLEYIKINNYKNSKKSPHQNQLQREQRGLFSDQRNEPEKTTSYGSDLKNKQTNESYNTHGMLNSVTLCIDHVRKNKKILYKENLKKKKKTQVNTHMGGGSCLSPRQEATAETLYRIEDFVPSIEEEISKKIQAIRYQQHESTKQQKPNEKHDQREHQVISTTESKDTRKSVETYSTGTTVTSNENEQQYYQDCLDIWSDRTGSEVVQTQNEVGAKNKAPTMNTLLQTKTLEKIANVCTAISNSKSNYKESAARGNTSLVTQSKSPNDIVCRPQREENLNSNKTEDRLTIQNVDSSSRSTRSTSSESCTIIAVDSPKSQRNSLARHRRQSRSNSRSSSSSSILKKRVSRSKTRHPPSSSTRMSSTSVRRRSVASDCQRHSRSSSRSRSPSSSSSRSHSNSRMHHSTSTSQKRASVTNLRRHSQCPNRRPSISRSRSNSRSSSIRWHPSYSKRTSKTYSQSRSHSRSSSRIKSTSNSRTHSKSSSRRTRSRSKSRSKSLSRRPSPSRKIISKAHSSTKSQRRSSSSSSDSFSRRRRILLSPSRNMRLLAMAGYGKNMAGNRNNRNNKFKDRISQTKNHPRYNTILTKNPMKKSMIMDQILAIEEMFKGGPTKEVNAVITKSLQVTREEVAPAQTKIRPDMIEVPTEDEVDPWEIMFPEKQWRPVGEKTKTVSMNGKSRSNKHNDRHNFPNRKTRCKHRSRSRTQERSRSQNKNEDKTRRGRNSGRGKANEKRKRNYSSISSDTSTDRQERTYNNKKKNQRRHKRHRSSSSDSSTDLDDAHHKYKNKANIISTRKTKSSSESSVNKEALEVEKQAKQNILERITSNQENHGQESGNESETINIRKRFPSLGCLVEYTTPPCSPEVSSCSLPLDTAADHNRNVHTDELYEQGHTSIAKYPWLPPLRRISECNLNSECVSNSQILNDEQNSRTQNIYAGIDHSKTGPTETQTNEIAHIRCSCCGNSKESVLGISDNNSHMQTTVQKKHQINYMDTGDRNNEIQTSLSDHGNEIPINRPKPMNDGHQYITIVETMNQYTIDREEICGQHFTGITKRRCSHISRTALYDETSTTDPDATKMYKDRQSKINDHNARVHTGGELYLSRPENCNEVYVTGEDEHIGTHYGRREISNQAFSNTSDGYGEVSDIYQDRNKTSHDSISEDGSDEATTGDIDYESDVELESQLGGLEALDDILDYGNKHNTSIQSKVHKHDKMLTHHDAVHNQNISCTNKLISSIDSCANPASKDSYATANDDQNISADSSPISNNVSQNSNAITVTDHDQINPVSNISKAQKQSCSPKALANSTEKTLHLHIENYNGQRKSQHKRPEIPENINMANDSYTDYQLLVTSPEYQPPLLHNSRGNNRVTTSFNEKSVDPFRMDDVNETDLENVQSRNLEGNVSTMERSSETDSSDPDTDTPTTVTSKSTHSIDTMNIPKGNKSLIGTYPSETKKNHVFPSAGETVTDYDHTSASSEVTPADKENLDIPFQNGRQIISNEEKTVQQHPRKEIIHSKQSSQDSAYCEDLLDMTESSEFHQPKSVSTADDFSCSKHTPSTKSSEIQHSQVGKKDTDDVSSYKLKLTSKPKRLKRSCDITLDYVTNECPQCNANLIPDQFTTINISTGTLTMKCQQCLQCTHMIGVIGDKNNEQESEGLQKNENATQTPEKLNTLKLNDKKLATKIHKVVLLDNRASVSSDKPKSNQLTVTESRSKYRKKGGHRRKGNRTRRKSAKMPTQISPKDTEETKNKLKQQDQIPSEKPGRKSKRNPRKPYENDSPCVPSINDGDYDLPLIYWTRGKMKRLCTSKPASEAGSVEHSESPLKRSCTRQATSL